MDRPELRYKANDLLVNCDTHFDNDQLEAALDVFDQILALIPDIEQAKKQERERILTMLESYPLNQLQRFPTRVEIEQALKEEK